ncbi:MAG: hypothetical protein M3464_17105 [Chloroflexota bacterium]|nr:hypothetical protein [Chloroflexota bacterium]
MTADGLPGDSVPGGLPETPHELPFDRSQVDALLTRVRDGEEVDLLDELLATVDWSGFSSEPGIPLSPLEQQQLVGYYREKFADIGALYLAELLATEFMTEQRARGDIVFSDRLLTLGRTEPELWAEISRFFRRKEMVTALLTLSHRPIARHEVPTADGAE